MSSIPIFKFALREDVKNMKEFLPTRAEPMSTGYDVRAAQEDRKNIVLRPGSYVKIPLGFRAFPEQGYWFELKPRSSSFTKKHLHALYGTVDNNYEGNCYFCAQYIPDVSSLATDLVIEFGERIGQIVPVKLQEMNIEEISNEQYDIICKERNGIRGAGGFGASGDR